MGSLVIQVRAIDKDIGINGAVRYKILQDSLGDWQTFSIDQTTGAIMLQKPLDRERQKVYEVSCQFYGFVPSKSCCMQLYFNFVLCFEL